jgi:hypothetical protein
VRAFFPSPTGRGNSFRYSPFADPTARHSLLLLFAIRHSLFAIRYSPILPLATRCSPLAKEASAPVLFSPPPPRPTPMPRPPGQLPNFSHLIQQMVLDIPNPNS